MKRELKKEEEKMEEKPELSKEVLKDILKQENPKVKDLLISEKDFKGMADPLYEKKTKMEEDDDLKEIYRNLIDILKFYCDIKEEYYGIIALWIMGTYVHDQFPSYPYLFLNAMRGSGKTRTLKLITSLANNGQMLNSLTEAVLFRTEGMLAIDEFEGITRKGTENLRELLNSAYKKGTKVKRLRKSFSKEGERQVVEEFDVYRPISLANIWGMESVLGDRCITLVLEKSNNPKIVNLVEIFDEDEMVLKTKALLEQNMLPKFSNCVVSVGVGTCAMYREWNIFMSNLITHNYTNYTNNIKNTNYTNYTQLFERLKFGLFNGRELELCFPLLLLSWCVGSYNPTETTLSQIMSERRSEDMIQNTDISLIDFVSQEPESNEFITIKDVLNKFKEYLGNPEEEWLNTLWLGRALKRLNLVREKRRKHRGVEIILNTAKAQEKIKMFR